MRFIEVYFLSSPTWKDDDVIATNIRTNEELKVKDLYNQKLLLPYISDDGEEVFFYGQFNEKNHWDCDCLINVYKNNDLLLIMEATYNDGNLIKYEQAIPDGDNIWSISSRETDGDLNKGDTWKFSKKENVEKEFTIENVQPWDVLDIASFQKFLNLNLIEFYHGNTSKGYYNDDTGNVYLVQYNSNNTVKTLYCGNFKDGVFNDNTGNAWYITKAEDTDYMYYKGHFKDGAVVNNKGYIFENPVSQDKIDEITKNLELNCDLLWKQN